MIRPTVLFTMLLLVCCGAVARTDALTSQIILRMSFHTVDKDLGDLRRLVGDCAWRNGYAFQDVGGIMPHDDMAKPFFVNLTRGDVQIVLTNIANPKEMLLVIRGLRGVANDRSQFNSLIGEIRVRFPNIRVYDGP